MTAFGINGFKVVSLFTILAVAALLSTLSSVSAFSLTPDGRGLPPMRSSTGTRLKASSSTEHNGSDTKAEEVVRKYFDGVNKKDPEQLRSCFGESATIRDVCALDATERTVQSDVLVDRCMEFVTAHPDCLVRFHYGPNEHRQREDEDQDGVWVVAHWYEIGTWLGESCGIPSPDPPRPMTCEGQTRFRVAGTDSDPKIQEFVVTRTFTEWENAMIAKRNKEAQLK